MQMPMDAERLLHCLRVIGKLAGFSCATYIAEQFREGPERTHLIAKQLQ